MDYSLYNQNAEKVGKVPLPDEIFGLPENKDLLYQVVTSQIANKRQAVAHTKDRGEVSGGGKKPWKQKGTGRARHGSIRSPIWKGGGATFGPRNDKNFKKKINKKMARKALFMALSSKIKDKEIVILEDLSLSNWKTKEMAGVIRKVSELFPVKHGSLLLVLPSKSKETIERAARNLPKVDFLEARNLNALNVLASKNILLMKESIGVVKDTFAK